MDKTTLPPTLLVADAGSTKTHWRLISPGNDDLHLQGEGINPALHSREQLEHAVAAALGAHAGALRHVTAVYFYGAGCIPPYSQQLCEVLSQQFPHAHIQVESDLLGAARAACGHKAGMACILGTGANSCLYDGQQITAHTPSLGYILGDEGSGSHLGRTLLNGIFKRCLPATLCEDFVQRYQLDEATLIQAVYRQPGANRYLASFGPFIAAHREEPAIRQLLRHCFCAFFRHNIVPYGHPELAVNFVGSIAQVFAPELTDAATTTGFTVGSIIQSPIEGIARYHKMQAGYGDI